MVTLSDYEYADLIDDQDKIRLLSDPTSVYAKAAAAGIGRAMDDVIISAFNASASTGKSGSTSTAFDSNNIVAHSSAGLTVAKLISAKKILDQNSVDPSITRYIVVSPEQIEDLLNTTSVTSSDFNTVKALATGTVDSFVGFKFIVSNRLKDDGTSRQCYASEQSY
jgi:transcriptional regulator of nitric oxide reductase